LTAACTTAATSPAAPPRLLVASHVVCVVGDGANVVSAAAAVVAGSANVPIAIARTNVAAIRNMVASLVDGAGRCAHVVPGRSLQQWARATPFPQLQRAPNNEGRPLTRSVLATMWMRGLNASRSVK